MLWKVARCAAQHGVEAKFVKAQAVQYGRDGMAQAVAPGEDGWQRGCVNETEAEAGVEGRHIVDAGEVEVAGVTRDEGGDDGTADAAPLVGGQDGDGCEFRTAVLVTPDLSCADDRALADGDDEVRPGEVHWVDAGGAHEATNGVLIGWLGAADPDIHA
jgi:hypothetical protein